jgi:spore coat protein U-like protein
MTGMNIALTPSGDAHEKDNRDEDNRRGGNNMQKAFLAVMAVCLLGRAVAAFAASATSSIQVSATVSYGCSMQTPPADVDFGTYDPALAKDNTSGSSSISFRCTKGTTYWTYIARTGTMAGSGGNLTYDLYTNAERTRAWNTAKNGGGIISRNNGVQKIGIYGKIRQLQDIGEGRYTETVTVTVEY